MLRGVSIRDMLIIDQLELEVNPGLNVLTGETGAGKSILLDSLGFVLGWRGRAELVRAGAEQGEVVAWFDLAADHPARDILREAGLPEEDDLILRRINTRDGRKTAWVNDRRCSGDVLRQLSDVLVELHGQHDDRGLLNPRGHRSLLDTYGQLSSRVETTRKAWRSRATAQKALDEAKANLARMRADEEFLRHAVAEFDALDPQEGEDALLDARRRLMQGAERMREEIGKALTALGHEGAEGAAGDAIRWLEGVADSAEGQLDPPIAAIGRALAELDDAVSGVAQTMEALAFNSTDLEDTEERLFALRALARKHDILPDDLPDFGRDLKERLASLDQSEGNMVALTSELSAAQTRYDKSAAALNAARRKSAKALDRAMMQELAPLKMERAIFETVVAEGTQGPEGWDDVTFCVSTNPGAPSGALNKIASGGELSRFLLALKVCLTGTEAGVTLIFDEIDRGVGGATADAVGRRLAQLASEGQVLVVTHSPQVAAQAGHHWRVEKQVADGQTLSSVKALTDPERVDEIARMLSGDTITGEARAAAQALIAS